MPLLTHLGFRQTVPLSTSFLTKRALNNTTLSNSFLNKSALNSNTLGIGILNKPIIASKAVPWTRVPWTIAFWTAVSWTELSWTTKPCVWFNSASKKKLRGWILNKRSLSRSTVNNSTSENTSLSTGVLYKRSLKTTQWAAVTEEEFPEEQHTVLQHLGQRYLEKHTVPWATDSWKRTPTTKAPIALGSGLYHVFLGKQHLEQHRHDHKYLENNN